MLKSSVILSRFILVLQLFDLLRGEPQTPHFHDLGLLKVSLSHKTIYFYLWRPLDASKQKTLKQSQRMFVFWNNQNV